MAVVLDRNGGCVGFLTVKDLVEEIVGDLEVW
jgi:CBS domain containing-hemolysin-like protein